MFPSPRFATELKEILQKYRDPGSGRSLRVPRSQYPPAHLGLTVLQGKGREGREGKGREKPGGGALCAPRSAAELLGRRLRADCRSLTAGLRDASAARRVHFILQYFLIDVCDFPPLLEKGGQAEGGTLLLPPQLLVSCLYSGL